MASGIKEIAKKVGLSYNTISNILNRGMADLYRPETRAEVIRAAQEVGYKVNRSAQTMRSQKTKTIGFAAANTSASGQLDNYTLYPFLVGLSRGLSRNDYHVVLVDLKEISDGDEAAFPKILREHFFDGLVVHYGAPAQLAGWAAALGIPVLWWDSELGKPEAHLTRDENAVSRNLTQKLIALGHKKIAMQVGKTGWEKYQRGEFLHYSFAARYQSYEAEMNAAGLAPIPLVGYTPMDLADQLKAEDATAVIVPGDISMSYIQAAQKLGWQIPKDLTIASLDIEARVPRPQVVGGFTYDRLAAGERAAALLLDWLASEKKSIPSETFTGEYREGDTIAAPRK